MIELQHSLPRCIRFHELLDKCDRLHIVEIKRTLETMLLNKLNDCITGKVNEK